MVLSVELVSDDDEVNSLLTLVVVASGCCAVLLQLVVTMHKDTIGRNKCFTFIIVFVDKVSTDAPNVVLFLKRLLVFVLKIRLN